MTTDDSSLPEVVTADSARTRRRGIVIASTVGVVMVLVAGTVAAVGGAGKSNRVHVAGETPTTSAVASSTNESTSTSPSTSTSSTSTSTSTSSSSVPGTGRAGDSGAPVVQPVQPNDLDGAISFAGTTVRLGEETPFTLTLRNVSDHPISFPDLAVGRALQVSVEYPDYPAEGADFAGQLPMLEPGESHLFTGSIFLWTQSGAGIGPAQAVAQLVGAWPTYADPQTEQIVGIPPVPLTVVPPGWRTGMPLDPSLGKWTAVMSADTTTIADDGTAVLNATIRNVGDQTSVTRGYGSLAIMCGPASTQFAPFVDHVVDPTTLAPGQEQTFSFELDIPDVQAHGATTARTLARVQCSVGLKIDDVDPYNFLAQPDDTIDSDLITLTVTHHPVTAPTTTTQAPSTTQP